MDEIKTKQQVVAKIQESTKILITVSKDPSVDALSAALGLTLLLDKQEKYATAIFSGETPPAIAFLEPEKTFDDTTDSLRDFIIALNKEKADHLRYKVVDDAVKIFITPYKTTIDESDLEFSQGDYNVELVIALGVSDQDDLDKALEEHGQILHDAAIITMTSGDSTSDLGGIDWHDSNSSSLSEMVAGLAEALKTDKKKSLLDAPLATALLTGIVAETDRFSNEHTTSKVMTVAANLMAAGADQQLIATELQASHEIASAPATSIEEDTSDSDVEVDEDSSDGSMTIKKEHDSTSLDISHEGETLADLDRRVRGEEKAKERVTEEVEAAEIRAAQEEAREDAAAESPESPVGNAYQAADEDEEPILGGTLNATTEQAADDARRALESDQNRTILSHSYLGGGEAVVANQSTSLEGGTPVGFPGTPSVAPGSVGVNEMPAAPNPEDVHSAYALDSAPAPSEAPAPDSSGIAVGGERVIQPLADVVQSSNPALAFEPTPPQNPTPTDLGLPLPPPVPDFSQINNGAPAPAIPLPVTEQPAILGDILAPEPPVTLDPTANAVAAPGTAYAPEVPPLPAVEPLPESPQAPASQDPGQFQIPPQ